MLLSEKAKFQLSARKSKPKLQSLLALLGARAGASVAFGDDDYVDRTLYQCYPYGREIGVARSSSRRRESERERFCLCLSSLPRFVGVCRARAARAPVDPVCVCVYVCVLVVPESNAGTRVVQCSSAIYSVSGLKSHNVIGMQQHEGSRFGS